MPPLKSTNDPYAVPNSASYAEEPVGGSGLVLTRPRRLSSMSADKFSSSFMCSSMIFCKKNCPRLSKNKAAYKEEEETFGKICSNSHFIDSRLKLTVIPRKMERHPHQEWDDFKPDEDGNFVPGRR